MGSSDSDDDELAAMRAARAAKMGGPGATLSALRDQQRRAEESKSSAAAYFQHGPSRGGHAGSAMQQQQQDDDDEDGPVVVDEPGADVSEDPLLMHDELRAQFPMSFGQQEIAVPKPTEVHGKLKREAPPSFGPPRPPGAAGGGAASFGPPRPPAAAGGASFGPPRPPAGVGAAGGSGQGEGEEEAEVGPPRPPGGGDGNDGEGEGEGEDFVGPPRPAAGSESDADAGPSGDYDDEEDGEPEDPYHLPITHEAVLGSAHAKAVTCMDIEHSGSRLVTGSLDYTIRIYDFNGMKSDLRAFRELEPQEGHPVLSVSWSPSGDAFLVVTGAAQAKIIDRDGHTRGEFIRGDMYIRDMKNTKGHVSGLCGGQWHPTDRYVALTCSEDGTLRTWDTHNIQQLTVIKPSLANPRRTAVSTCAYNADGRLIGAGLMDGSIQLWSVGGKFGVSAAVGQVAPPRQQMIEKQNWSYVSRASQVVRDGHAPGSEITSLSFSQDGNRLLSRGMDSTLKVWDLRKFNKPLHVWDNLPCAYQTTKCLFSPDEQLILTGVSAGSQEEGGVVAFYDASKFELVRKVGMPGNVGALAWHHRLNQIFVGTGNRKSGGVRALYDTTFSERGVMQAVARAPRKPSVFDFQPPMVIKTFGALPLYRDDAGRKRKREKATDEAKKRVPDAGMAGGMGKQGRIGTTSKTLLTQHLLKQRGELSKEKLEMDPREAILRHADKKDAFSSFTAAYSKTQPKPIYAQEEEEEEA